jgi:hypothetical protein
MVVGLSVAGGVLLTILCGVRRGKGRLVMTVGDGD